MGVLQMGPKEILRVRALEGPVGLRGYLPNVPKSSQGRGRSRVCTNPLVRGENGLLYLHFESIHRPLPIAFRELSGQGFLHASKWLVPKRKSLAGLPYKLTPPCPVLLSHRPPVHLLLASLPSGGRLLHVLPAGPRRRRW